MRLHGAFAALTMIVASACASSGASSAQRATTGGRDFISEQEITARANDAATALQIVQKLRPQMLTGRGVASPNDRTGETSQPKVYVDNVLFGDLASLSNVAANQVREVRFVNARDATTRWGTGHMAGVILVMTKR